MSKTTATIDERTMFEITSPIDGSTLTTQIDHSAADVERAGDEVRSAQKEWERIGPRARAAVVLKWRDWILDNEQHLVDVMQAESGKVRHEAALELSGAVDAIRYYAKNGKRFLADQHPRPHSLWRLATALTVTRRPYPLVGVITPWNFPALVPVIDVAPALMAGAAVLLKPSEVTPLTAVELARGWKETGAPDVFRVVTGTGATGAALVDQADYVQFTGSTRTGRKIAARAAERLIPVSLELGGKDAMIVLDDADLDRAVNGALWGGFFNSGQVCTSVERVYVESGVYDRFLERLVKATSELRHGPDDTAGVMEVGAMANNAQVEIVESHIADAVARGARVLTGGERGRDEGSWFQPTVLVDVDHTMRCMREETFGPTLPIMKVDDPDEAVRLANDSPYGLSATVWTKDRAKGERIARTIEAGAVNVNDMYANVFSPPVPMSGWGESGIGFRLGGAAGLLRYCRTQAITRARLSPRSELPWYPYSERRSHLVATVMRFVVARGRRRFRA
ncbi:aldehyde dehydrogenase family protein [Microbacterium sp. RD1]|uniref:aldehyde dehydrogenase family protein n=1 Tax=Microbacterium sp. RD1 TaxID=3457313 RepID=UPI003FA59960